jgi:hypothetical protein
MARTIAAGSRLTTHRKIAASQRGNSAKSALSGRGCALELSADPAVIQPVPGEATQEKVMGRGLLLWLIGIPLPIILLIWVLGGLHG